MAVHPILSIFRERGDNLEKTDSSEYVPKNDLFHPIGGKTAFCSQWGEIEASTLFQAPNPPTLLSGVISSYL